MTGKTSFEEAFESGLGGCGGCRPGSAAGSRFFQSIYQLFAKTKRSMKESHGLHNCKRNYIKQRLGSGQQVFNRWVHEALALRNKGQIPWPVIFGCVLGTCPFSVLTIQSKLLGRRPPGGRIPCLNKFAAVYMKPHRRKIIISLAVAATACVILFLLEGEKFLLIDSGIKGNNADAVVVLAGSYKEDKERLAEGTALLSQGKGKVLILPLRHPAIDWPWVVDYFGLQKNLPENKVLIGRSTPEDEPIIDKFGGTYVEALKAVQIMEALNLKSAIIVSSAYHMRRAQMAFNRYRSSSRIEFYYHPVKPGPDEGRMWWLDAKNVAKIIQEYKKVIAAFFIYNSSPDPAL